METRRIAVIGSGGREHALVWKLGRELGEENVFCLPGNGGIPNSRPVDVSDFEAVKNFCEQHEIKWIFTGPEQYLAHGIKNYFRATDIHVFGPDKDAARLEASKVFAKNFMEKYGVSTAGFKSFKRPEDAAALIREKKGECVIKYDGLAGGKGVFVCSSEEEAWQVLENLKNKYGNTFAFLVEDKLSGDELSVIGFTDGKTIKLLPYSQDHKQLYDGDKGPNTGGMGAYCPVKIPARLDRKIKEKIVEPTMKGIRAEKLIYDGVIYFGIMVMEGEPYLLEYNVRFGDPETEVLLPALQTDFSLILQKIREKKLEEIHIKNLDDYWVDVVLVSGGYPGKYETGYEIKFPSHIPEDVLIFHAGTKKGGKNFYTAGGRVLNVVGRGKTLAEAREKAYSVAEKIHFKNKFYRKDIGLRENQAFK